MHNARASEQLSVDPQDI